MYSGHSWGLNTLLAVKYSICKGPWEKNVELLDQLCTIHYMLNTSQQLRSTSRGKIQHDSSSARHLTVMSVFQPLATRNDTGVFVSDIVKGGLVDTDARLMQGDQILSVNGEDVRSTTQEAVAALLKVHPSIATE